MHVEEHVTGNTENKTKTYLKHHLTLYKRIYVNSFFFPHLVGREDGMKRKRERE